MLYEMLTGQPPYLAETIRGTLEQVLHAEPLPPGQIQAGLPQRLEAVCLRCLRKDPAERYPSAEELAEELRRFLAGEQTETGEFELVPGYELLEELGRGGTGVVYKARQLSLDRLVALKVFRTDVARVLTANRAVARLSHPNLVPVFDCGERDGLLFVAEELVVGDTLEQRIAGRPQSPAESARLVKVLAEAMQFVHQHGIVHRNLKPSVVHLNRLGVPRVNSFDLAFLRDQERDGGEKEGRLVGTPTYMAPEQAAGDLALVGPATDVYALGGILYEMLAGRPAFVHDSLMELLAQVRTRPPLPPRFFQPQVPPELETICLKCLQKEPARRFGTAADLAEALRWFLGR
jgi:serine/threonine protein kinase